MYTALYSLIFVAISVLPTPSAFASDPEPQMGDVYADIQDVAVPPTIMAGEIVQFTITGTLTSLCHTLNEPLTYYMDGNSLVVRPLEALLAGCETDTKVAEKNPRWGWFERTLSAGHLAPGTYRIVVRSGTCETVERVFTVLGSESDPEIHE